MGVLACVFYFEIDISVIDLSSGFSHPLEGWDHIVTMLGVGIWAAQLRGKAIWLLPSTFIGVMSLGGISGAAKYLTVPSAEILIILSCLVFSVLIIRKMRFTTQINVLIVAFFAFFHGFAHGQEISASASLISYTLGFMVATLLLHGAGILMAKVILISITFFISQLVSFSPSESATNKTTAMCSIVEQREISAIEISISKPPLNFSPPDKPILQILKPLEMYFVLSALLLIFTVSQFVCYVFYIKQRRNFVFYSKFFTHCFKIPLYFYAVLLTPSRSNQFSFFQFKFQGDFYV